LTAIGTFSNIKNTLDNAKIGKVNYPEKKFDSEGKRIIRACTSKNHISPE
jgi:hypothetical protein